MDVTNSAAPLVALNPTKVYLTTGINVTLYGEDSDGCRFNLGHYSTDFYLHSDTDITYREIRDKVGAKTGYQLPVFHKRGEK